jgi:hypothetical protein
MNGMPRVLAAKQIFLQSSDHAVMECLGGVCTIFAQRMLLLLLLLLLEGQQPLVIGHLLPVAAEVSGGNVPPHVLALVGEALPGCPDPPGELPEADLPVRLAVRALAGAIAGPVRAQVIAAEGLVPPCVIGVRVRAAVSDQALPLVFWRASSRESERGKENTKKSLLVRRPYSKVKTQSRNTNIHNILKKKL